MLVIVVELIDPAFDEEDVDVMVLPSELVVVMTIPLTDVGVELLDMAIVDVTVAPAESVVVLFIKISISLLYVSQTEMYVVRVRLQYNSRKQPR